MKTRLSPSQTIVAVDVGTTKICVLVGHRINDKACDIIGIGRAPSTGLVRGVVVDVGPTVKSVKSAIQEAVLMAGCPIESVYVGISGAHIRAYQSSGMIPIKHGVVREPDLARVLASACAIPLPDDEQILHSLPQQFVIDGKHSVRDPLQMHGIRLEARVNLITGNITQVKNLIQCCEASDVKVHDVVLEPIASADAVLSEDERDLGVALLDIGGGTSDFAIYQRGAIRHTKIFPIAGALFTNDVALCLRTTRDEAERIKRTFGFLQGHAFEGIPEFCSVHTIDGNGDLQVRIDDLSRVLTARAEELLRVVAQEIDRFNLRPYMPAGFVLTGGGALMRGLAPYVEKIVGVPTRVGIPKTLSVYDLELQSPMYATAYGLLLYAMKQESDMRRLRDSASLPSRLFWKMKSWIADFF
ncbi:MAG: cell division protein FtsA [Candidatus Babeliaceae bacterium]|nr:cell division protein FtsA [Candidatus Babeliaceae bacterium]